MVYFVIGPSVLSFFVRHYLRAFYPLGKCHTCHILLFLATTQLCFLSSLVKWLFVVPFTTFDLATPCMDRCLHRCFRLVTKVHVKRCRPLFYFLFFAPTSPATLFNHAPSSLSFFHLALTLGHRHQFSMPLTIVKRSRDSTPTATHSFNMVKRFRPTNATLGAFVRQAISSKQSTLSSTYGPVTCHPQPKAKNRPQLQVELPPMPSLEFIGLSPITSFLSNSSFSDFSLPSSASSEDTDQCDNRDELLEPGIIQGLNYDGHSHHEVPYYMLNDTVTPEM